MKRHHSSYGKVLCFIFALAFCGTVEAQRAGGSMLQRNGGQFDYTARENGDRIPDYSYAGYELSEKEIPTVPNKIFIKHISGDATALIQSAIDYVSALKPDANGFRGAVLLDKGTFEVAGELLIHTSGVVLRGSGFSPDSGTILQATGKARETVINVWGKDDVIPGDTLQITDNYVPLGAQSLTVSNASGLKAGDRITIRRIAGPAWCAKIGIRGDRPGNLDLFFDRTVKSVNGSKVTFDVPLTNSIGQEDGGGTVIPYTWLGRISQVGVENLVIRSDFERLPNLKDEEHAWYGVWMQNVENAWVRQMRFYHLAGSAVVLGDRASKITVEDCIAREFVSEIANGRRNMFYTMGQQTLFQRIHTELGHHDFLVGARATGPNVFIQCKAESPTSFSGALEQWSTGTLFDIVYINGNELGFQNRESDGAGAGWTGANGLFWNCQASILLNYQPPTAYNWAFGCWGGQFKGAGSQDSNSHISPRSFFYAQLSQRLGREVSEQARVMPLQGESSTRPTMEQALKLTIQSLKPVQTLYDWIKQASMPEAALAVKGIPDQSVLPKPAAKPALSEVNIENGWITWGGKVLTGRSQDVPWWSGSDKPYDVVRSKSHITRYVPARRGKGLTDELEEMTDLMLDRNVIVMDHNYGLWYDRRRDDHQRLRRMDGEVWAPFYELPFARSGEGRAWDGLSKYDLTRYNNWYFSRLAKYAEIGREKGLVLINQHYFQHNILEAGAHYADFPWRPANNINAGIPMLEPVNYAGDKRIFYDVQFYDISSPEYAELHKKYIRHNLENFPEHTGAIHSTSFEFTGPFHFVKFWLETIGEWERETGKNALVALSAPKDVQDQVLADPELAKVVDIIDIRYWYEGDRGFNAPPGGVHLAPRQHISAKTGGTSGSVTFQTVYNAVRRYREENNKAVIYNADQGQQQSWAIFMAGGSLSSIPKIEVEGFTEAAAKMKPMDATGYYLLGGEDGYILYPGNASDQIALPADKSKYEMLQINPRSGRVESQTTINRDMGELRITLNNNNVLWLREIN